MRDKIIIFGRSPFVKKIDFSKIDYNEYSICCINTVNPNLKQVNYVVSTDYNIMFPYDREFEWISPHTNWLFLGTGEPYYIEERKLSWCYYSSSIAVAFAILRGYKEIYLAGVDLKGEDIFEHYDGKPIPQTNGQYKCQAEKEFIKNICYKYGVKIFTLNIDNNWINFADIGVVNNDKN